MSAYNFNIRQMFIVYAVAVASPVIRVLPAYTSSDSGSASVLLPLAGFVEFLLLLAVVSRIFKKTGCVNICDAAKAGVGETGARALCGLMLIWALALVVFYVKTFSIRYTSTLLPQTDSRILAAVVLTGLFFVCRNRADKFARATELMSYFLAAAFAAVIIMLLPQVDWGNLYPYSRNELLTAAGNGYMLASVMFILPLFTVLVSEKSENGFWKKGVLFGGAIAVAASATIVVTVGSFGAELTAILEEPLFTAAKNVVLFGAFQRIEPLFITVWAISDIVLIAALLLIIKELLRRVMPGKASKLSYAAVFPLVFLCMFLIPDSAGTIKSISLTGGMLAVIIISAAILLMLLIAVTVRSRSRQ